MSASIHRVRQRFALNRLLYRGNSRVRTKPGGGFVGGGGALGTDGGFCTGLGVLGTGGGVLLLALATSEV